MSKVYDRIEWAFLEAMLLRLGFDAKWVTLIMLCVFTVRNHVIRDEKEIGPIIPTKASTRGPYDAVFIHSLCGGSKCFNP